MINPTESWQVDVNGEVFETNFEGLVNWIEEGSLLRVDKVKRGNLRWLEAGKIPLLMEFFNAKDLDQPMPLIQFSVSSGETETQIAAKSSENAAVTQNFAGNQAGFSAPDNFITNENLPPPENFDLPPVDETFYQPHFDEQSLDAAVCLIHNDAPAAYLCDTCVNTFCKACPNGYGGSVKICPMCGSMCASINQLKQTQNQKLQHQMDLREGFGIADFGRAFAYPFKFKASLFFGGFLYMLFTLGQTASGAGSFMMLGSVIICFMLANMMTFSVLANTVDNFSQGKIGGNFMPSWDEFSLWDDMIHPFFLSMAAYVVSFGLTVALIFAAAYFMWDSVTTNIKKESVSVIELNKIKEAANATPTPVPVWVDHRDKAFQDDLDNMNKELQIENLKSLGAAEPGADLSVSRVSAVIVKTAGIFGIPILLSILWGLFYYPIACCVAGYTRSFAAVLNPSVGLDTIKRMGFDYVKILGMTLLLAIISVSIGFILHLVLAPFDLPRMGNLPAIAVGSWFSYYFFVVFSLVLGYALYKNAEKMNLFGR